MQTQQIIQALNQIQIIDSYDYEPLELIDELTEALTLNSDGHLACPTMINLLERHPDIDFGSPGEPIHTLEKLKGHYEILLIESLKRQPTIMTIFMLNRLINNTLDTSQKQELIDLMSQCATNKMATSATKEMAMDFYNFQTKK
jgi:hypothetical protein